MEIQAHFSSIKDLIIEEIEKAQEQINIAVAWFTHAEIFDALLKKLPDVEIKLLILNDDINNRTNGLDFQYFIDKGGKFHFGLQSRHLNHKYCIIDNSVLITGSFNYTYLANSSNFENVLLIRGACDIINKYKKDFDGTIQFTNPVSSVSKYLQDNPSKKNVFSFQNYGIKDLYQYGLQVKQHNAGKAEEIFRNLENKENGTISTGENFLIPDVVYRQWKEDYYLNAVQYRYGILTLKFSTIITNGACIHGPKAKYAWLIRSTKNPKKHIKCHRISNVRVGRVKIIRPLLGEELIYFSTKKNDRLKVDDECHGYKCNARNQLINDKGKIVPVRIIKIKENSEMTCLIHFKIKNLPKYIDLIEGLKKDDQENHWHCFDINLTLNKEPLLSGQMKD